MIGCFHSIVFVFNSQFFFKKCVLLLLLLLVLLLLKIIFAVVSFRFVCDFYKDLPLAQVYLDSNFACLLGSQASKSLCQEKISRNTVKILARDE